jgi:hypothetical protein
MADYTQPDVVQKRVRFFDGQFLVDQDFIDEQRYHLDRERRYSRMLGITGVVSGLTVTKDGLYQIAVGKGTAIDALGRTIVLVDDLALRLPDKFAGKQDVELRLVYQENPTDMAQTGSLSERRWDESPKIAALAPDGTVAVAPEGATTTWDGPTVLLATFAVAGNGDITVDQAVTPHAGLSVPGKIGIGTIAPDAKLTVSAPDEHLRLRREGTETTGGKHLFLELDQVDSNPPAVPEVFPSIRFHHHYRFWHRIEAQPSGFHFKDGNLGSDTYSPVKTGALEVTGGGGSSVDLTVNGRLRSNNNDGGLWITDNRFVGGFADKIGFWSNGSWRLAVTRDGKVGIGTGSGEPPSKLSVSASRDHLALIRESTETTGGKQLFLELAQVDTNPPRVPETAPSIRFLHHNRFWHRLEAQLNGFHFKTGDLNADTYSSVKTGALEVTGAGGTNVDLTVNGRLRSNNNDGGLWITDNRFVGGHSTDKMGFWSDNAWRLTVLSNGNVGINHLAPESKLAVSASTGHLQLRRENTETTGGKQLFLELYQHDPTASNLRPEVYPSIRFHHNNRFWHRLEARLNGFHFKTGDLNADTYSSVKTGALEVTGAGGTNVDLTVNGRLRSNNNDGGLWVSDNRFIGGHSTDKIGIWNNNAWRLTVQSDGNVGVGTVGPPWKLSVSSPRDHLALYRESTEATGGKFVYLELAQIDSNPAKVPEVFPSIRFNHHNRYSHRIEGQGSGIHFKDGNTAADNYSDIKARTMFAGKLSVSAGAEHALLRREKTETAGGKQLFLELYQDDPDSAKLRPEVWPSIRFHHNNRFWIRLEGRGDGFHFKDGYLPSDSYVPITCSAITIGGVTIGEHELRILKKLADGDLEFDLYNVYQNEYTYAADYAPYDDDRRRLFSWRRKGQRVSQGRWKIHYPS